MKFYRDPLTGETVPERRSGTDRRTPATFTSIFASQFRRRKSKGRRKTDRGAYVDIYDSRSWAIAISVLLLSFMDALLTGLHMTTGYARELNPVMNTVINHGGLTVFFFVKAAMTIFPVAIILIHKEWSLGRLAARLCLWSYIALSLYHGYIIYAGRAFSN